MTSPHDRFARVVFRQPEEARTLLRAALSPAMLADLDLSTLALVGNSLIDDRLSDRALDLLFSVECKGSR